MLGVGMDCHASAGHKYAISPPSTESKCLNLKSSDYLRKPYAALLHTINCSTDAWDGNLTTNLGVE